MRIFRITAGCVMVAMIFMRPPQREHAQTSTANILRNKSARAIRHDADRTSNSADPHAAPVGFGAGVGTISDRHFACGTNVPWYLS